MEDIVYLRDEDGTGSLHACSKEDPGAIPHAPVDSLQSWRPIETAPKGGVVVLVYVPDFNKVCAAWFCEVTGLWPDGCGSKSEDGEPVNVGLPTHWMPLPDPPK